METGNPPLPSADHTPAMSNNHESSGNNEAPKTWVMPLTTLPLPDSQGLGNVLAPTYCVRISSAEFPIIALTAPLKVLIQ